MTFLEQLQTLLPLIDKACHDGAGLAQACRQIGLCARTVQRWQRPDRQEGDQRMARQRAVVYPANQLSEADARRVKREAVSSMVHHHKLPARHACVLLGAKPRYLSP